MRHSPNHRLAAGRRTSCGALALLLVCTFAGESIADGVIKKRSHFSRKGDSAVVERVVMETTDLHQLPAPAKHTGPKLAANGPEPGQSADVLAEPPAMQQEYTIAPGDTLQFQSFSDPSLTREEVRVLYDGSISLPLIQDVTVGGLTRTDAESAIRTAYSQVFRDPQIALTVRSSTGKFYSVLGDVLKQDRFPYQGPTTVVDAINIAGGLRVSQRSGGESFAPSQGTLTKAFIIRRGPRQREVIELDLRGLTDGGAHASDTPIYPGDIVYVPEGVNLVFVIGEVRGPGAYNLAEGETLLKVIGRAGGHVDSTARLQHVVLMRQINETDSEVVLIDAREILKTGQDVVIKPGDLIYIPRKNLVRLEEFINRFTGSISPILSLYTQAFDAYYADRRNKLLFDNNTSDNQIVNSLQTLQGLGDVAGTLLNTTPPALPAADDQNQGN